MKKIVVLGICMLVLLLLPTGTCLPYNAASTTDINTEETSLMVGVVFGISPKVSYGTIYYFAIPQFQWLRIPIEDFKGHIGVFFIYGAYFPKPSST